MTIQGNIRPLNQVGNEIVPRDDDWVIVVDSNNNANRATIANVRAPEHAILVNVPTAVTSWPYQHDLGVYPSYICVRNDGVEVVPAARFDDLNNITLTFQVPFTGKIQLHG